MLGFLLILFIIFILIPIIRTALTMNRIRRQAREFFNNARQTADAGANRSRTKERKPGWSKPSPRKKVYRQADGEYVDWEEVSISETQTSYTSTTDSNGYTEIKADTQVTDVEWEEINVTDK
ncbi:MAG: DUF4834 family protein [Paramuribaculum sp.]|nr:DUF4834 family protein [Paramuribaculum sp.]